jgi:hypothetical protein
MYRTAACALAISMMCCLDTAGAQTIRPAPSQQPPVVAKPSPSLTPTLPSPSPSAPSPVAEPSPIDDYSDVRSRASSSMPQPDAALTSDETAPAAAAPPTEEAPSYSDLCQATPRPPWCSR